MNSPCLFLRRLGVEDLGPPTLRQIAHEVAQRYGMTVEQLRGPSKAHPIAHPRQEAMALSYGTGEWSNGQVGFYYHRHYSTVIHARREVAKRRAAARRSVAMGIAAE